MVEVDYTKLIAELESGLDGGHDHVVLAENAARTYIIKLYIEQRDAIRRGETVPADKVVTFNELVETLGNMSSLENDAHNPVAWLKNKLTKVIIAGGFTSEKTKDEVIQATKRGLDKVGGLDSDLIQIIIDEVITPISVKKRA